MLPQRFSMFTIESSKYIAVLEKSKPNEPELAANTRFVAVCPTPEIAGQLKKELNHSCHLVLDDQEDSGVWRISKWNGTFEKDLNRLLKIGPVSGKEIFGTYEKNGNGKPKLIAKCLTQEDAKLVSKVLNHRCPPLSNLDDYEWRSIPDTTDF